MHVLRDNVKILKVQQEFRWFPVGGGIQMVSTRVPCLLKGKESSWHENVASLPTTLSPVLQLGTEWCHSLTTQKCRDDIDQFLPVGLSTRA